MKKAIEEICNRQIQREGYSSVLYLAMASWAEVQGFAGTAEWLYAQADEEKEHMLKFVRYINERGGHAIIPEFEKPAETYKDVKTMFDQILEHEQFISASINEIVSLTLEEKDFTTNNWIQWFVSEQIEEEASVREIIDKLNLVGEHNMYLFDRDIISMRGSSGAAESGTD